MQSERTGSNTMPFEKLRDRAPLKPGKFTAKKNGCLDVELLSIITSLDDNLAAYVRIGSESNSPLGIDHEAAVVLSAFFGELAKQLA